MDRHTERRGRRRYNSSLSSSHPAPSQESSSSRRTFLVLWLAYTVFTVYVTTLPFSFTGSLADAREKLANVPRHVFVSPEWRRASGSDMLQNVLLFMPLGALTVAAAGRRWHPLFSVVLAGAAGLGLSVAVETLQLFTRERTTSLNDVATNGIGAVAGGALAAIVLSAAHRAVTTERLAPIARSLYPLLVWTTVIGVATWHPFDTTIDVGGIAAKVRSVLADPWQAGAVADEAADAVRYALFGAAAALWLRHRNGGHHTVAAAALGGLAAIGFELSQFFINSRSPGGKDMCVGIAGACLGAVAARGPLARRPVAAALVVVCGAWLGAALMEWSAFAASDTRSFDAAFFFAYAGQAPEAMISKAVELSLAFFPIGFALALVVRRSKWPTVIGIALVLAGILEGLQRWMAGRYPDVTDVVVLVLGAAAGAWAAAPVHGDAAGGVARGSG